MTVAKRAIQLSLFLAIVFAFPATTHAQLFASRCNNIAQCPDGFSCQTGFFGLKYCLFEFCNADTDCSRRGARCTNGICRIPVGGGGGSGSGGGSGTHPSGEGARCGPQSFGGGVIKSIGCRHDSNAFKGSVAAWHNSRITNFGGSSETDCSAKCPLMTQSGHGAVPYRTSFKPLRCLVLSLGGGNETTRLHRDGRQRGSDVAACSARTAT